MAAAIVMSTVYGYDVAPTNDPFVFISEAAMGKLGAIFPGAAVVNALPFLRHVPSWMPGCAFKRFAEGLSYSSLLFCNCSIDYRMQTSD